MEQTPNLTLPYIIAAQAQKHVTHNEAIRMLDALVQLSIIDRTLTAPPTEPADGGRYIVADGATGDWAGRDGMVAAFQDGAWTYLAPQTGWLAWVEAEDAIVVHGDNGWAIASTGGGGASGSVNPTPLVGVATTADATNRLAVSSPASLFTHDGDDHRMIINKATAADTASFMLQSGFEGRAEIGLSGDDDLHLKVSADGAQWHDAIVADRATGAVSFPNTTMASGGGGTGGGTGGGANTNLLINGAFGINQRGFAGGALADGRYGFDRWKAVGAGTAMNVAGDVVTLTSGEIVQKIEPARWDVTSFAGRPLTLSLEDPTADITVRLGSTSGRITAGSGRRAITLTPAAGDGGVLDVALSPDGGATSFSRVKLEFGSLATAWQPRGDELALAQIYFCKSMLPATTPGDGVSYANDGFIATGGATGTGSIYSPFISFPVTMRRAPTLAYYRTQLGADARRWAVLVGNWVSFTGQNTVVASANGFVVQCLHPSISLGSSYGLAGAWTADAEL